MAKRAKCPRCGSSDAVPIVYGYPDGDLFEQAQRGEVAIGGCVIMGDDPTHRCRACGHAFVAS
jgi:hypothetical protein